MLSPPAFIFSLLTFVINPDLPTIPFAYREKDGGFTSLLTIVIIHLSCSQKTGSGSHSVHVLLISRKASL
jgi:hypothetical protein